MPPRKRPNPLAGDENRTPSKVQDLMRNAAQEHSGDVGQAPGAHHDEVHTVLRADAYDLVRGEPMIGVDPLGVSVDTLVLEASAAMSSATSLSIARVSTGPPRVGSISCTCRTTISLLERVAKLLAQLRRLCRMVLIHPLQAVPFRTLQPPPLEWHSATPGVLLASLLFEIRLPQPQGLTLVRLARTSGSDRPFLNVSVLKPR